MSRSVSLYASPRVWPLLILGFASGLPLALTGGTLQAWATVDNVALQQIGFLTLVGSAYTLKFLWAPLVDRYVPPLLGRRRGWMFVTQVLLAFALMSMAFFTPSKALFAMAMGMSVPLLLLGLSAGTLVPRAGHWMQAVKPFFGVLMLALALTLTLGAGLGLGLRLRQRLRLRLRWNLV